MQIKIIFNNNKIIIKPECEVVVVKASSSKKYVKTDHHIQIYWI